MVWRGCVCPAGVARAGLQLGYSAAASGQHIAAYACVGAAGTGVSRVGGARGCATRAFVAAQGCFVVLAGGQAQADNTWWLDGACPFGCVAPCVALIGRAGVQGEALDTNLLLVEHVKKVAERRGCTAAQVSLRWLYKQAEAAGVSMVAIPGTKRVKYLEANAAALDVELTDEDMGELNSVFTEDAVSGDRYPIKALMFTDE